MSAPVRFLVVAVVGWAGLRAASVGALPGAELFTIAPSAAAPPPISATSFSPIEPAAPARWTSAGPEMVRYPVAVPTPVPFYYRLASAVPEAPRQDYTYIQPLNASLLDAPIQPLDDWPLAQFATASPFRRSLPAAPEQTSAAPPLPHKLDRLQLSAWALLRSLPGPEALASGGTLGGSQAGARLTYKVTPWLAASFRTSSPVNTGQGGEVAAGLRFAPLRSVPLAVTLERRQAISRYGGRSAFAGLIEGGLYDQPIAWDFRLDGYAQAGMVGLRSRDFFADGGFTLTRPVIGRFSAGVGAWAGMQPGLYRVDAGPRLTMQVRNSMRVHLDWRQRLSGNAEPGSGPAVTLAANF